MIIVENTNLNGTLEITDPEGVKKSVVSINTNLTENTNNFNFNFTVIDKVAVDANIEAVQLEMNSFMAALRDKMTSAGYLITI